MRIGVGLGRFEHACLDEHIFGKLCVIHRVPDILCLIAANVFVNVCNQSGQARAVR
jgi:hypothetical protein